MAAAAATATTVSAKDAKNEPTTTASTKDRDSAAKQAQKRWELENQVKTTTNENYRVDLDKMKLLGKQRPWKQEPRYFKKVKMSALALIKVVMHARTGQGKQGIISDDRSNWIEVMGLLQGYYNEEEMVITDSFAMPVDASEVECSMNEASQLYMINYLEHSEKLGKKERAIGWYHSHPGYSCFLSGIDVNTQTLNQQSQDPFVALVVDPVRTISTGKVEIKAFRTYPEGYKPPESNWDRDSIPQNKIEEYGVYLDRYYELPITVYRSEADATELDLLWNKYWMKTLSTSPLVANRFFTDQQLQTVTQKLEKAKSSNSRRTGGTRKTEQPAETATATSKAISVASNEFLQGLLGMQVKQSLFNPDGSTPNRAAPAGETPAPAAE